jgi:probable rRNA maturation factor
MTVFLDNRQEARLLDQEALSARIQQVLAALELGDEAELSLVITDDPDIAVLNQQYLGRVGPTNVLAFAQGEGEGSGVNPGLLGDVVVSIDTSDREAAENDLDPGEHLMRLIIHGLLHLLGYDHVRGGPEARRMEELTEELLEGSAS